MLAGTRILVPQSRKAEMESPAQAVAAVKSGDPRKRDRDWPDGQRKAVAAGTGVYSQRAFDEGARLLAGMKGDRQDADGWFVRPTLFTDVNNQMTIAREEIFGPVLCALFALSDEAEAVAICQRYRVRPERDGAGA